MEMSGKENEPVVVGLQPWLPGPLARSPWWTAPVRAERLAALRVGTGAVLLLDVLGTYLPAADAFFGGDSLGAPGTFPAVSPCTWPAPLLGDVASPLAWRCILLVWAGAAVCLALGLWPRRAAGLAWCLAMAVSAANPFLLNSGDNVRTILLLYLVLTPCGAVGSLLGGKQDKPTYIYPWALRLLFVQLVLIYFCNGLHKLREEPWRDGTAIHLVLGSLDWTRASAAGSLPLWLTRILTWATLVWEVGFPLLVMMPATRSATLWVGVLFHIGTGLALVLGPFPLYMLCLYLPLVPWERYAGR